MSPATSTTLGPGHVAKLACDARDAATNDWPGLPVSQLPLAAKDLLDAARDAHLVTIASRVRNGRTYHYIVPTLDDAAKRAGDYIYRLSASVHRAENGTLTGRNSNQTASTAEWNFEHALTLIVGIEDAYGIDAAAKLSDRLTRWRQRAVAARLLTNAQVLRIEAAACSEPTT